MMTLNNKKSVVVSLIIRDSIKKNASHNMDSSKISMTEHPIWGKNYLGDISRTISIEKI